METDSVYTLYSPNQLAVLLTKADVKKGEAIAEKLKAKWENESDGLVWTEFTLGELEEGRECDSEKEQG